MSQGDVIMYLVQALLGLGVYTIRADVKAVRELLTTRIDYNEKRLDKLEQ